METDLTLKFTEILDHQIFESVRAGISVQGICCPNCTVGSMVTPTKHVLMIRHPTKFLLISLAFCSRHLVVVKWKSYIPSIASRS